MIAVEMVRVYSPDSDVLSVPTWVEADPKIGMVYTLLNTETGELIAS